MVFNTRPLRKTTFWSHKSVLHVFEVTILQIIAAHEQMSQCCTFRKRIIPRRALQAVGRCYCWLGDTLQTTHRRGGGSVWLCATNCRCVFSVCVRFGLMPWLRRDVAICMGQATVSAGACVILVRTRPKLWLNSSLNPQSQCGTAYGLTWMGCDRNTAIDRPFSLKTVKETKARFVKEAEGWIHRSWYLHLKWQAQTPFDGWWIITGYVYIHLCVCI